MSATSAPAAPMISVVLATHNGEKFLDQQLRSIAEQTLRPFEVIVSDDHSTDTTMAIVGEFAKNADFKVTVRQNIPALGFGENFLSAASLATGDIVAFCDQDDVWDAEKLATCAKHFASPDVSLVVHTATLVDQSLSVLGDFRQNIAGDRVRPPLSYDPYSTFWGFTMVFRREILALCDRRDRFIDYITPSKLIAHDRWVVLLSQMVGKTVEIDRPLALYRQHGNNLFGAGQSARASMRTDLLERTDVYIRATHGMIKVVEALPGTLDNFPLFEKTKCLDFLRRALQQHVARREVYAAPTRGRSLMRIVRNTVAGDYRDVAGSQLRIKSLVRDLLFILKPNRQAAPAGNP